MIYSFPMDEVKRLVELTKSAKDHHVPYTGDSWGRPEDKSMGLTLVGDTGVYLMSNAVGLEKNDKGYLPLSYASECNPDKLEFDDWWSAKNEGFGPDDGAEFFELTTIEKWIADNEGSETLRMSISAKEMNLLGSSTRRKIG